MWALAGGTGSNRVGRGARLVPRRKERWRREPWPLGPVRASSAPPACLAGGRALNLARVLVKVVEQRCAWPGVALPDGNARVEQSAHESASPLAPQDGAPGMCICMSVLPIRDELC